MRQKLFLVYKVYANKLCSDEHHRRSPDCPFFAFAGTTAPKAAGGKKSRTSKSSRLSTQSIMTTASEGPSIPDLDVSIDASTLSVNTVASSISAISNKKGTKNKGRSARASKVREPEIIEVELPVIPQEVPQANTKYPRGSKRTSDLISEDDRGYRESTVKPEPAAKRRNTGAQGGVMGQVDYPLLQGEPEAMAVEPAASKPARGGKKRVSSRDRKASAASAASLRAGIPDNATIEAELEADLDRPMSDEDKEATVEELPKKRGRKPKATRASTASTRGQKAASREQEVPESHTQAQPVDDSESQLAYNTDVEGSALGRSKSTRTKASKKNTAQTKRPRRGSAESIATMATELETQPDSSMITTRTEADDSGHETDASVGGRSVARKGSKRKAPAKGRGKKGGTGLISKNIEDIVQSQSQVQTVPAVVAAVEAEPSLRAVAAKGEETMDVDRPAVPPKANVEASGPDEEAQKKPTRTAAKARKAKPTKSKKQKASDRPPQLSMPGAFSPLMADQSQDIDPSFTSVLSPTSPPLVAESTNTIGAAASLSMTPPSVQAKRPPLPPRSPLRNMNSSARPTPTPQRSNRPPSQKETTPSPSPQSSDAENAPPSTRPPSTRPPLAPLSPSKNQITRMELAPGTPRAVPLSPSKIGGGLKSDVPWTSVDVEMVFATTMPGAEKENANIFCALEGHLTSPEKKMTVEEWINWNAQKAEEQLRAESERVVGVFEKEGGRALRVLEGIEVSD